MKQPEPFGSPADVLQFFVDFLLGKLRDKPSEVAAINGFILGCAGELGNISAIMLEVLEAHEEALRAHAPTQEALHQLAHRLRERSKAWQALTVSVESETVTPS